MNNFYRCILAFILSVTECYASNALEADLLADLQHYSSLATETRQNVDYMPYVISTLNNKDLIDLGVLNLRDAISILPGVDLNIGMAGVKNPIFRGSNPYAFGQSRLIIDGVEVNDQIFGGYSQYLDFPIDIIHRIEVVRGPGSILSHINGFAGSIHVITKANRDDEQKEKNQVFSLIGSDQLISAGLIHSAKFNGADISTDLYYQKHDVHLPVADDRFVMLPNASDTDQGLKNYQVAINYKNKNTSLIARSSNNLSGVSYGQSFSLSDDSSDFLDVKNNSIEFRYKHFVNKDISFETVIGYFDENRELQNKVMPDGAMMLASGRYFVVDYKEKSLHQRFNVDYLVSNSHKLNFGVHAKQSKIIDNNAFISDDNLINLKPLPSGLFSNNKRTNNIIYIEDMIDINEKLTFQIGAKFNQFSDVEDQSTYRLSLVHRYDNENIFKIMYSQAVREPSWREQYLTGSAYFKSNDSLLSESVTAYELAYIHRTDHSNSFKINTYLLKNSDQIDAQNTDNIFNNSVANELYGAEFEYEKTMFKQDKLHINYSYLAGNNVSDALANAAQGIIKIYYLHRTGLKWNYSAVIKYISDKGRVSIDSRDDVSSYSLLNITAAYQENIKSFKLSLSINNVLDEVYDLPSPDGTYQDDFPQAGRTWLFRLSKEF